MGFFTKKYESIDVEALKNIVGKVNLIDIRESYEYNGGHIRTAKNIPMDQLLVQPEKHLKKEDTYYIVCQSGGRSARACNDLAGKGYHVVDVKGGTGTYLARNGK